MMPRCLQAGLAAALVLMLSSQAVQGDKAGSEAAQRLRYDTSRCKAARHTRLMAAS